MDNPDPIRTISSKGKNALRDIWLDYWHRGVKFDGNEEHWFHTVLDFLSMRGDEIIPRSVREIEERVINAGRSQEYLAALAEVVSYSPQHNEYDKGVLVLTASPEERARALSMIGDNDVPQAK